MVSRVGVAILIGQGARPNAQDRRGNSPLHKALFKDQIKIVLALIKAGASADSKNNDGVTPRMLAEARGLKLGGGSAAKKKAAGKSGSAKAAKKKVKKKAPKKKR